jgi:hypothetical protein
VVWPPGWRPGICAAIPVETDGAKLLGAPIGTEPFRTDFVVRRVSKATALVAALLPPSATWTVLRFCINERVNYPAQVTEFPLVQDSLARMDTIIDQALLRAAGLPPEPPDPLTHLTTLTLRSLRTVLGGLGIRRYSGLAGEIACFRGRTVFYEFAESYAPGVLAGATEDLWAPITLGAAENAVWTEVAGLFRDDMDDETTQPHLLITLLACFGRTIWPLGNPPHSTASLTRRTQRQSGGPTASAFGAQKPISRPLAEKSTVSLVQLLHSRGRLTVSCLLKSNRFPRSGCWLAGPGGFLAGSTNLNPAEHKMVLRLRLLRSPASLDVGDVEGGILCRCNRRVCLTADPMHFFHCPSNQGQYVRRHDHIRDAIIDQIDDAIRPEDRSL